MGLIYTRPFVLGNMQKRDTPMSVEACPHRRFLALLIGELIVCFISYWTAILFNKGNVNLVNNDVKMDSMYTTI